MQSGNKRNLDFGYLHMANFEQGWHQDRAREASRKGWHQDRAREACVFIKPPPPIASKEILGYYWSEIGKMLDQRGHTATSEILLCIEDEVTAKRWDGRN